MRFAYDDGGRAACGYKGTVGDCGCRAIAIATGIPYQEVYDRLRSKSNVRDGLHRVASGTKFSWCESRTV